MARITFNESSHKWEKKNLMTISSKKGSYDIYRCALCGLEAMRGSIGPELTSNKASRETLITCPKAPKITKGRIKIIRCTAGGESFYNIKPGTIHDIIDPPIGQKSSGNGVWVMGIGEPVKVLNEEFDFLPAEQVEAVKQEEVIEVKSENKVKGERKEGDLHPNGKWEWRKTPSGYDWRNIKKEKI